MWGIGYWGMCVLERKERERPNTTAQVPSLLNGCSSMKGRRKEGGKNSRQSVCVSVRSSSFYSVTHRPLFHSPPAPVRTMMRGESPFSPQGGADDGDGSVEQGGHCAGGCRQVRVRTQCRHRPEKWPKPACVLRTLHWLPITHTVL